MSLNSKIFLSFMAMAILAVCVGLIGWRCADGLTDSLNDVIMAEMPLDTKISHIGRMAESLNGIQQSLLNANLSRDMRGQLHNEAVEEQRLLLATFKEVDDLLSEHKENVDGWDSVIPHWTGTKEKIWRWLDGLDHVFGLYRAWEDTAILSPDELLTNLYRFRGDHFLLSTKLSEMVIQNDDDGTEFSSSDRKCGFGHWQTDFESGKTLYTENPVFRDVMRVVSDSHRRFHQSAHDLATQFRAGTDRAQLQKPLSSVIDSAREVISHFEAMAAEGEKARKIYEQAQNYSFTELNQRLIDAQGSLRQLTADNRSNLDTNSSAIMAAGSWQVGVIRVLTVASLLIGIGLAVYLGWTIKSRLTGPLTSTISLLASNASTLHHEAGRFMESSETLRSGAAHQESALVETSTALEEIASMANQSSRNVRQANDLMQDNSRQVKEGSVALRQMGEAMDEISDSSGKIGRIIKTIEEIAFQTNLLALNAAVEAARAGEAGKGFAVVADEVRNLAQRSAQASRDTANLIQGTVQRIDKGAAITRDIEERFEQISDLTTRLDRLVAEINVSTEQQNQGLDQINRAVAEIGRVTQENSSTAEQSSTACAGLNQEVDGIREAVEKLESVLGKRNGNGHGNGNGNGKSYHNGSSMSVMVERSAPRRQLATVRQPRKPTLALPSPK